MPKVLPSMSGWWNRRPPSTRLLVYAAVAILAFVMAASVGAVAALMVSGGLSSPTGGGTRPGELGPAGEQGKASQHRQEEGGDGSGKGHREAEADRSGQERADRSKEEKSGKKASSERERAASKEQQGPYVAEVGEIQAGSVEAFSDSHEKLLRYDTLTSADIEEMKANQAALHEFADQASDLKASQKYGRQKQVFVSAIDELHQGAQLAYVLAADPLSATQGEFDDYDRLTNEAAADLQQSNDVLGKDYKTIGGLREVNTP